MRHEKVMNFFAWFTPNAVKTKFNKAKIQRFNKIIKDKRRFPFVNLAKKHSPFSCEFYENTVIGRQSTFVIFQALNHENIIISTRITNITTTALIFT